MKDEDSKSSTETYGDDFLAEMDRRLSDARETAKRLNRTPPRFGSRGSEEMFRYEKIHGGVVGKLCGAGLPITIYGDGTIRNADGTIRLRL